MSRDVSQQNRSTVPIRLAAITMIGVLAVISTEAYSTFGKWGKSPIWMYANPASPDLGASAIETALKVAMTTWNSAGTAIQLAYAGRSSDITRSYNGRSVTMFRNVDGGSTIASTYAWSFNGALIEADVVFWDGTRRFFTGSSGCSGSKSAYVEDIATHEFGHVIGLSHSAYIDATMYPSYSACSKTFRTLASDDLAGIRWLYKTLSSVVDSPPVVTILAPSNGATVTAGTGIQFSGTATDVPDGTITSRLMWSSNISGALGTGGSFVKALPAGTHTITAKVTDSIGYVTARAIILYVK
jgi:Matrixin/Bacterial Ig domain